MGALFGSPAQAAPIVTPPPAPAPPAPMPVPDPEADKRVAARRIAGQQRESTTRASTIIGDSDLLGA